MGISRARKRKTVAVELLSRPFYIPTQVSTNNDRQYCGVFSSLVNRDNAKTGVARLKVRSALFLFQTARYCWVRELQRWEPPKDEPVR
jgi:hypothetical protein